MSLKGRAPALFVCLMVGCLARSGAEEAAASNPPMSPKGGHLQIEYRIAFLGIPFGRTQYDIHIARDGYRTQSHFETSGIVSAFWQAVIDATANGQLTQTTITPAEYDSHYARGDKRQRVKLTYRPDRLPTLLAEPAYNVHRYPVTDEQKKQGIDPLSAATSVLAGTSQSTADPCGSKAAVFDGRRRYDIDMSYMHDEPVKLDSGLYSGKAHLCELHYNQLAGFKPKILKEGRALPLAYAFMAEVQNPAAPRGHYVVPLKLWASTGFGTVTATLTQLKTENGA